MDKLRLVVCSFFPAFYPPSSGGEQRLYYIYHYLSKWYDITMLSATYPGPEIEYVDHGPGFQEVRIPKSDESNSLHWEFDKRQLGPECSGLVVSLLGAGDSVYLAQLQSYIANADIIIHDSPFTVPYDRTWGKDGKLRIYNAYNLEGRLARQIFQGGMANEFVSFVEFLEESLVDRADQIWATCEEERQAFALDYKADIGVIRLVPNGFERSENKAVAPRDSAGKSRGTSCVFVGSGHPPNVEAVHFIFEKLAPEFPDVTFHIIGGVSKKVTVNVPKNCRVLGFVAEDEKNTLIRECDIALNPLFSGAGTNLKMLDYMAEGAAILATPVGVRGLELTHNVDAIVAMPETFSRAMRELISDVALRKQIGDAARKKAYDHYTWERIADAAHRAISEKAGKLEAGLAAPRPLNILVVNDFAIDDAASGGQARIFNLLDVIGRQHKVTFLSFSDENGAATPLKFANISAIRVKKTPEHVAAEAQSAVGEYISVQDLVAAEQCMQNPAFIEAFSANARSADVVVFEHCYLAPLMKLVPERKTLIYSSLNVEALIKRSILKPRKDWAARVSQTEALEQEMVLRADLTVCVSEEDADHFRSQFPTRRYLVIENGVHGVVPDEYDATHRSPSALFIGSAHMPNVEAAQYIVEELAPRLPAVRFVIVGSVAQALAHLKIGENVRIAGIVSNEEKAALFRDAAIAINPMFSGGGSSLKVPDFMSAGLPLISTEFGVRGYRVRNGVHYIEADRDNFADTITSLLGNVSQRKELAAAGRQYVQASLTWGALGKSYEKGLVRTHHATANKKSMLVVTYRFADPAPGGAEAYLNNTLKALDASGQFEIHVAAPLVGSIKNKWHYSADYGSAHPYTSVPEYVRQVHRFELDADNAELTFSRSRRLASLWAEEGRLHARKFLDVIEAPCLLGGWNYAEAGPEGRLQRWTTGQAELMVQRDVREIVLRGYAPNKLTLTLKKGGEARSMTVDAHFDLRVSFSEASSDPVITIASTVMKSDADPRELGVLLTEVLVRADNEERTIRIDTDFEAAVRRADPERWIESLIELTERRSKHDDELFGLVRGPHSSRMNDWLRAHMRDYDAVLIQGVPFSTSITAAGIARELGKPFVLLPHYHMEDRYYHWRGFYDAFRSAALTLAAPVCSRPMFFDKLSARSSVVPGGGVTLSEFKHARLEEGVEAFRELHPGSRPFVLLLGRKAEAKNYPLAVEAVARLKAKGVSVDLVMIGPDDDGATISAKSALYYGPQHRSVVLGALKCAVCVINMSDSESFGIVIVEAWLANVPVIVQRRCLAFNELVADGKDGFLVETVDEIQDRIVTYLTNPETRTAHALAGHEKALQYSWPAIADKIGRAVVV